MTTRCPYLRVDIGDLLDCTPLVRPAMFGSDDAAICTLPKLLDELVLRIYDERRVECLKRMALHDRSWMCVVRRFYSDWVSRGRGRDVRVWRELYGCTRVALKRNRYSMMDQECATQGQAARPHMAGLQDQPLEKLG